MDVKELWTEMKDAFHETSENVFGRLNGGQRRKWLTKDIITIAKERRKMKPEKRKSAESTKHYNYLRRKIKNEEKL